MKKFILVTLMVGFLAVASFAKERVYTVTLTVQSAANQKTGDTTDTSAERGSIDRGLFGGIAHSARQVGHHHEDTAKYIEATGSDGNVYELTPENKKVLVLPGQYQGRFTDRYLILRFSDGKEFKFQVVAVKKIS